MTNDDPGEPEGPARAVKEAARPGCLRRFLRACLKVVAGLVLLLVLCAAAGACCQAVATHRDRMRFPPPGQMVDVGGFRLHLLCAGTGGPAVVLDAPVGASHLVWSLVQPDVAAFTRVCSFDRAGYGWSDPGPAPRTCGRTVEELHTLLTRARVPPPYVLVGNSIGGLDVRLFAFRYPGEVAGLVLVDPAHEDQMERLPPGAGVSASEIRVVQLYRWASRLGVHRLANLPIGEGSSDKLPAALVPGARAMGFRSAWADATYGEMVALRQSFGQVREARRARGPNPLGDLPLEVLTRGEKEEGAPDAQRTLEVWTELNAELARESTRGEQAIVPKSGHFVEADKPGAVVEAIRKVVGQVRAKNAGP